MYNFENKIHSRCNNKFNKESGTNNAFTCVKYHIVISILFDNKHSMINQQIIGCFLSNIVTIFNFASSKDYNSIN